MDQTMETNTGQLLDGVTGIIKRYEAQWQKTGEKYNIFEITGSGHKEVMRWARHARICWASL
jgi:hypothetical protein